MKIIPFTISNSRLKTWRHCKKAHDYKYNQKIQKKRPAKALVFGKILHEMVDAHLNQESWGEVLHKYLLEYEKMFEEEQEEYGDIPEMLPQIMKGYVEKYKDSQLTPIEYEGRKSEYEFTIPLVPKYDIYLTGYIDRIVKDKNGLVWLTETKTCKSIPDDENKRFSDIQTALYYWVADQIGLPKPDGILWDYVRKKVPTRPRVLKSGGLSKAKSIDTTKEVYLETIKEEGLDPEDYTEMLDMLENKNKNFYARFYYPSPDTISDKLIKEAKMSALEMYFLGGDLKSRNIQFNCNWWCDYYELCQAELRDLDSEYIRKDSYEPRRRH